MVRVGVAFTLLAMGAIGASVPADAQVFGPGGKKGAPPAETAPPPGDTAPPGQVFRPSRPDAAPSAPPAQAPAASPTQAPPAQAGSSQVEIAYRQPKDPQFNPIRERLMRRQVLEQLQFLLSPLKLPRKLLVQIDQCNAERRPYQPGGPVTICYEYVAKVDQIAPRNPPPGSLPRELMIVGAFVQTVLQNVSVAIFDILELPVWGREEDAADQVAAFIMVSFGKEVALKVMVGAAWFFDASDRTWTGSDFASAQSPEAQRFFNYLCIAFGADQSAFKFLLDQNMLPLRRAQRCGNEFHALRFSFLKTIMPHVDQNQLKKVQAAGWLMLDEPK